MYHCRSLLLCLVSERKEIGEQKKARLSYNVVKCN